MKLILFVVIVCFMLPGCLPTSQKKAVIQKTNKTETNSLKSEGMPSSADINVSKKRLDLPFNYYEYQLWGDRYEHGETGEHEYPIYNIEENDILKQRSGSGHSSGMYMCVNVIKKKFNVYIVSDMSRLPPLFDYLVTADSNSVLDSIVCFDFNKYEHSEEDWKEQSFTISKSLEVTLYQNKLNDGKIIEQHPIVKYNINNEGKFIRVE